MVDVSTTALSGFFASEKRLNVAANNIANANTDNFRAQDVAQTSNVNGGVATRVVDRNPPQTPRNDNQPQPSDVEIDRELVNANFATYSAQANLKVIQVQKNLDQALLDIQA